MRDSGGAPRWRERSSASETCLSRRNVKDIQRARILSAITEVAAREGYVNAAVGAVVARAGVSRRTFYELFEDREDCFLAAFEWGVEHARAALTRAAAGRRSWRESARCGLAALLRFFDAEPQLARLLVVEALAGGPAVLARRTYALNELIGALREAAPRTGVAGERAALTAESVVGGTLSVIHTRLVEQRASGALIELHGQLMALVALPYLGARAAREELSRTPPETAGAGGGWSLASRDGGGQLIERLQIRLTYRTVRCLLFLGEQPGANNREIARGAEIPDEGQASKMLRRLAAADLIANSRPAGSGQPNRWALTRRGERVLSSASGR